MFPSALRQRLASIAMQIVFVDNLRKELSLAYNLNTSSLRAHRQKIVTILQEIVTSAYLELPVHKASNQPTLSASLGSIVHKVSNQLILLALL